MKNKIIEIDVDIDTYQNKNVYVYIPEENIGGVNGYDKSKIQINVIY